jgi:predicted nuclease of restriction endonuclease-like RecB superfamily
VLALVAASLGVTPEKLEEALFADLPGERLVAAPAQPVSAGELALRTNLAIAQAFLFRSAAVVIELEGNARAVVRHAKLRGLICTIIPRDGTRQTLIEISGPYTLFRRTLLYGRALGELIPLLAWCRRFRLRAECIIRTQRLFLQLGSGDPIFPASEPRLYDSKLEERFASDFRRIARDWDVIREPEPVLAGNVLIFPDFALQHRTDSRRWLLEVVGFWTPEYVARKLALLRTAGLPNLILCIDETRNCAEAELPPSTRVVPFRRRIDAHSVLTVIEGRCTLGVSKGPPRGRPTHDEEADRLPERGRW